MKSFHFFVIDNLLVGVAVFLITSCSDVPTPMKNKDGSTANARLVGGKGVLTYGSDGSMSYTFNNEKTILGLAKELRNGAIGVAGIHATTDTNASNNAKDVSNNASNNALSGLKDNNATKIKLQEGAPAVINANNAVPVP